MSNSPRYALISVSNKEGISEFAKSLCHYGFSIIATGQTADLIRRSGTPVIEVSSLTGFPEIMNGRVKTLHPKIHGGILGDRALHEQEAAQHDIQWIEMVVVNLYPFGKVIENPQATFDDAIENIDIGGPTMIRAAAKNMAYVSVITDPLDYELVLKELHQYGEISDEKKRILAEKAFGHTAEYDAKIAQYLTKSPQQDVGLFPRQQHLNLIQTYPLRYGENPHQDAAVYYCHHKDNPTGLLAATLHQGKQLSYNNLLDADAALDLAMEFDDPTAVIIKHNTPCGVASHETNLCKAFMTAVDVNREAAFGGIIALNKTCDVETAQQITEAFFEVVLAPGFSDEALACLKRKSSLRLMSLDFLTNRKQCSYRSIAGGMLKQTIDTSPTDTNTWRVVSQKTPTKEELSELLFAWRVVKHAKSNAIVISKDKRVVGIGQGQVSRVEAVRQSGAMAKDMAQDAVVASDAFFPFKDSIELLASLGVRAIVEPGGSMRDKEVIDACNQHRIVLLFTDFRCFKH